MYAGEVLAPVHEGLAADGEDRLCWDRRRGGGDGGAPRVEEDAGGCPGEAVEGLDGRCGAEGVACYGEVGEVESVFPLGPGDSG